MKIIFDFDDVLFDAYSFKQKVFSGLTSYGIHTKDIEDLYKQHRKIFNPRTVYKEALENSSQNISEIELQKVLDELFSSIDTYIDRRMITLFESVGKDNCYIVTAGDEEFQKQKIKSSLGNTGVDLDHIFFVKEHKGDIVQTICKQYPNEKVVFVDDKKEHIQEVLVLGIVNVIPVLYDVHGFETLSLKIKELSHI